MNRAISPPLLPFDRSLATLCPLTSSSSSTLDNSLHPRHTTRGVEHPHLVYNYPSHSSAQLLSSPHSLSRRNPRNPYPTDPLRLRLSANKQHHWSESPVPLPLLTDHVVGKDPDQLSLSRPVARTAVNSQEQAQTRRARSRRQRPTPRVGHGLRSDQRLWPDEQRQRQRRAPRPSDTGWDTAGQGPAPASGAERRHCEPQLGRG